MSAERALAPDGRAGARRRPALRMLPGVTSRSPRAPFVVLVLVVLGAGLIGLLFLNTSVQQGSFGLTELEAEVTQLRDRQTLLADEVAARSTPDELARRARLLGMRPVDEPKFLELPGGLAGADGTEGADGANG